MEWEVSEDSRNVEERCQLVPSDAMQRGVSEGPIRFVSWKMGASEGGGG